MKVIIRTRDSGKAKELLEYANEKGAAILTQNKRAFRVKADSLGFKDVEIIDYEDLRYDNYSLDTPIVIHNADKAIQFFADKYYGVSVIGFTATQEE